MSDIDPDERPPRLSADQSAALFDVAGAYRAPRATLAAIVETNGASRSLTRQALSDLERMGLVHTHPGVTPTQYAPTRDGVRAVELLMQRRTR